MAEHPAQLTDGGVPVYRILTMPPALLRHATLLAAATIGLAAGSRESQVASHPAAGAIPARDTIRGVVFDSLMRQPISGATVIAEPGGASTTTDEQGRFTLAAAEKIRRVAVFHLLLDKTGIGSLTANVDPAPAGRIVLATPSAATIWPRLCPGVPRPAQLPGILFGTARAADGRTRVAGVRVRVNWDIGTPAAGTGVRQLEIRTDSLGSFYACGVPTRENLYVVAYSAQFVSGVIALAADSVPLRKQDLVLGRVTDSASNRPAATGVIRGVVRDERRRGVGGASVEIDGLERESKADAEGKFVLRNVPTGSRMLLVRAVGFTPAMQPVEVLEREGEEVTIEVVRSYLLPGVKITERERLPVLRAEFEERRKIGFGVFFDSTQLSRRFTIRNIFEGVPNLEVTGTGAVDRKAFKLYTLGALSMSQACPANVYIDGRPSDTEELASYNKEWIVGVEIYTRQTTAPAQYRPLRNFCGVVLVWTRQAFMK